MLAGGDAPAKCVWHCSLRSAPGDRVLSDAEWADVAAEVMDRTASPRGDDGACRWVAVRHADDHVPWSSPSPAKTGNGPHCTTTSTGSVKACRAVEER